MKINDIQIRGTELTDKEEKHPDSLLDVKRSFRIDGNVRGKAKSHELSLEDEDLVEFVFDDGTTWLSSPNTLEEIFPEAAKLESQRGARQFQIPAEISMPASDRGILKKAIVKVINILTKKAIQVGVHKLAVQLEDKQLKNQLGLFRLSQDFQLLDFNPSTESQKTFCLLIHGTASSIEGSFGKLMDTELMKFLQNHYGDRVLAFQHRTLSENPLQNVLTLIQQLPKECTLHLISTSRGGLVGEVLSRFCNSAGPEQGFSQAEMTFMRKEYSKKYFKELNENILDIKQEISGKNIRIERFVRIACPAGGTTLASKRMDNFLNISLNLIGFGTGAAAHPAFIAFKNLISAVIDSKNQEDALPGLEVQRPTSPFIQVLNGLDTSTPLKIENSLVIISGDSLPKFRLSALLIIASKLFFRRENDLVVDTVSMSMGTQRTGSVQEFFYDGKDINHFKYFENKITSQAIQQALSSEWGKSLPGFNVPSIMPVHRRDVDLSAVSISNPLLQLTRKHKVNRVQDITLKVSLSMGDLTFASYPVLAGHFEDDSILYAEKKMDKNMDGLLSQFQKLGNYPGKIKDSRVFLTHRKGFQGAVVIGLGKPEKLTTSELTQTVETGVIDYLFDLQKNHQTMVEGTARQEIGISSLIIGCGYGGLPVDNSIRAIVQGVHNANVAMRELKPETEFIIQHLEFIEVFEDKAINCLFVINQIAKESGSFSIQIDKNGIKSLLGLRKRIPLDITQDWWNRLTVITDESDKKTTGKLKFSTSTQSARVEQQSLLTTPALMEGIIEEMSTNDYWNETRAKTIFEMLIPNDFKDELKRHGNIVWVLDPYTATYPWELLQEGTGDTKPICVSSGMVRQLETPNYRKNIKMVTRNTALVVADPDLEGFADQLEGALAEGKEVCRMLQMNEVAVTSSYNEKHAEIIEKLFGEDYKIIHLSGHGVFHEDQDKGSGMIIGNNKFLSTREIQQMSTVPEFVFVNCCHLGKTEGAAEELYQLRYKLAANIGTQLINNGVRCVIAAGWAVNDDAALEFAKVFYGQMNKGHTFGQAVKKARSIVFEKFQDTNTWGAYQAYGDPYYRFRKPDEEQTEKNYLVKQEAEIDLENLLSELEIGDATSEKYLEHLDAISKGIEKSKIRNTRITELEAVISMELREYSRACNKFKEVITKNDNFVSFSSFEKYQNVRAKKVIEDFLSKKGTTEDLLTELDSVIGQLKLLMQISPTAERINILGSTYKRKAFLTSGIPGKLKAYELAAYYYRDAFYRFNTWYSLTNWLTIEAILELSDKHEWNKAVQTEDGDYALVSLDEALRELLKLEKSIPKDREVMNYWDMITAINIMLCRYILNFSKLNSQTYLDKIMSGISELWKMAGSKGKRFAEIEHLEFIIDVLSVEENQLTKLLHNNVTNMKLELEKLIRNR